MNVKEILFKICENEMVYEDDFDLITNGVLDSFGLIELFSELEDYGIAIQPTQIDRKRLRTPKLIEELIEEYKVKIG